VAVLAQLADGNNRTGSIVQAVELSERQVYNLLNELENDFGLVRATEVQGRYALTEAGSVA
jgi:DNA-binding IclR family transcriptional regulator